MTRTGSRQAAPIRRRQLDTQPLFNRIVPARPMAVRAALVDVRARFHDAVSEDTLGRLELVLAEIMNNVAEHGAGIGDAPLPLIHLSIVRHDTGLACAITDDGLSLPAHCLQPRILPRGIGDAPPEGGFGWYLIQDLTQSLCYYREDRRNFLAFSIPFAA